MVRGEYTSIPRTKSRSADCEGAATGNDWMSGRALAAAQPFSHHERGGTGPTGRCEVGSVSRMARIS